MTSSKECPSEQIIVNQRCNLIIQYLERQSRERLLQAQQQQNENDRGNKRELNQVFKKRAESVTAETEFNSKFLKKRRISSTSSTTSSNQDQTSAGDSNLIEIDDTNHNSVKLF
jgi:hypothetical protein